MPLLIVMNGFLLYEDFRGRIIPLVLTANYIKKSTYSTKIYFYLIVAKRLSQDKYRCIVMINHINIRINSPGILHKHVQCS